MEGAEGGSSIVRELHVYGTAVLVHGRDPTTFQHQGFGTLLMEEAEQIAREEHGNAKLTPYVFPSQKFMIPLDWKHYQLLQLINKALARYNAESLN
ncbi:hypothetical protein JVT61DRAFT_9014 [Boletus reticuloceps]|uniref:N-acetyltransferase domain-containing protein n=1 Tax=Boletus reticuloceps TaxID=495285 RepID=A0A8I2YHC6_9AGAM|nr:hypothetical protein JVT61DRAFT_9014 [Boletus reticuloceps]